ncbi:MAG: GTP-binding protein, partial [Candidatus Heimdallarchaeota archaeon]|nr:GTP-binding protein [Candidatus Heimdallarchaeota archaeon]MCK4877658.1 GTP-binding protein [Candidatus Heimdallarchaeota archaeon]
MSIEPKRAYKIVLIGDPEVGKTSIRRKYMGKSFRADYLKTLGADFAATKVNVEGDTVLLTIWDLAGQSIFHGMRSSF